MTYIVKDECIKCKLTDCVEVCPVDCFYKGRHTGKIIYKHSRENKKQKV